MTEAQTAQVLALVVVAGFFALVFIVLVGFVDIRDPTIAKIVGTLVGYVTAILNPIIFRYFGTSTGGRPDV